MDNNFTLSGIEAVANRLKEDIVRTPLIKLNQETANNIYLKLENLQPIGAFKIRGAGNAIQSIPPRELEGGVWTASAGNMAQGVAWYAKQLGITCTIVVPKTAPKAKLDAIKALGGKVIKVTVDEWFGVMETHSYQGMDGTFIHPFANELVMQGNATIALEIYQDLPQLDTVIVPYGGGGLISGIARFLKQIKPNVRIYACEPETAAALHVSLDAGEPTRFDYRPSFVDGMGAPLVFEEMWEYVSNLVSESLVVSLNDIASAVKLLMMRNKVVAEGAGAAPVAAALHPEYQEKLGENVVCIVSGGNIDIDKLGKILKDDVP